MAPTGMGYHTCPHYINHFCLTLWHGAGTSCGASCGTTGCSLQILTFADAGGQSRAFRSPELRLFRWSCLAFGCSVPMYPGILFIARDIPHPILTPTRLPHGTRAMAILYWTLPLRHLPGEMRTIMATHLWRTWLRGRAGRSLFHLSCPQKCSQCNVVLRRRRCHDDSGGALWPTENPSPTQQCYTDEP